MADLIFVDSHNVVAYLEKLEDNADFAEIVDFLNASPIRKATEISQSSGPTTLVADETVHLEKGDSMERAVTTATSLDAEQGSGSINRTQSMTTLNEPIPQGTGSGSSPMRQDTILGDRPAQTRFERLSKQSNKLPLSRVNTLGSGEDNMKLQELMDLCTKLSDRVLDLENVKDAQDLEIKKLKKRDKKLESKKKSRTPQLKRRLFKVRIESSAEKSLGRYGHDIGVNTASTPITTAGINITTAEPVTTASAPITTTGVSISTTKPSTPPPTTTTTTIPIEDEDLTIAQTLMKIKSEKSKAKGVTMQEPSEYGTRVRVHPLQIDPKDKGKSKMVEPEKPKKKKDQIEYDADVAQRLQAELDKEARLEREREEEASKATNIAEWDDVQAMMDADYELATKLQEQEREELTIEERAVPKLAARSSKGDAEEELDQESYKRQKTGESSKLAKEPRVKEADELSQEELQQMMIIVPEQGDDLMMLEGNRHLHAGREGVSIVKGKSCIDAGRKALGGSR
ncbi:hypothetical protein Tco_1114682 [Tanacetum coccineum]|uniref:Uncharacterized protein n=1 Tax=Tanacetum coccineum TaxID=301880 RepID=A0ABQ5IVU0_9ASTR